MAGLDALAAGGAVAMAQGSVVEAQVAGFAAVAPSGDFFVDGGQNGVGGLSPLVSPSINPFASTEAALARVREVIGDGKETSPDEAYRAQRLYLSGGHSLPIQPGISRTIPFTGRPVPNVLFINHSPPGSNGSGTYSKAMARHVISRGGQAALLFLGPNLDPALEVPQFLVPFAPSEGDPLPGAAKAKMPVILSNVTNPNGLRIRDLPEPEMRAYVEGLADAVAVAARHMQADVIVANHAMVSGRAAQLTGLPYAVVCHGSCVENVKAVLAAPNRHAPTFLETTFRGVRAADGITTLTTDAKTEFAGLYGVDAEEIDVIPNGFNTETFVRRPDLDRSDVLRKFGVDPAGITHVVSYTGRMDERKGIPVILNAAALLKPRMPGVHFVLAGGGALLENYRQLAQTLGIADIVHFIGHKTAPELAELNNVSDLSLLVSHDEPFGIAALEAAGCGTPVIATAVGGLKDIITPEFGVLIPPNNPEELFAAMHNALQTGLKGKIGASGAAFVHSRFPWSNVGDMLLGHLRRAMERRERRRRYVERMTATGSD